MKKTEIILVASGKGGVGKSTFTINLASVLAEKSNKVCIIDLDLNLGKLDILLGVEKFIEKDISDILNYNTELKNALVAGNNNNNLFLLPAGRNVDEVNISKRQLLEIIDELKEDDFDYIFLDCPAGIDILNPFRIAAKCSNRAIIVTTQEKPSLRDADSTISILENYNYNIDNKLHLVINRYTENKSILSKKNTINKKEIQTTLAIPLIGVINDYPQYRNYVNSGVPGIYQNNKIYNDFQNIADEIIKLSNYNEDNHSPKFKLFSRKA